MEPRQDVRGLISVSFCPENVFEAWQGAGRLLAKGTLIEAARATARSKGSYFGAQYRQIAKRRGPGKAAVAVAHSLSDLIWHMLTTGECFTDPGADYVQRRRDPQREADRLVRQLHTPGFQVSLTGTPTPAA